MHLPLRKGLYELINSAGMLSRMSAFFTVRVWERVIRKIENGVVKLGGDF